MNDRIVAFIFLMSLGVLCGAKCLDKDHGTSIKLVDAEIENLTKLEWSNATGKKKVIVKEDVNWYYAGMEAIDSIQFNSYLKTLLSTKAGEFIEMNPVAEKVMIEKLVLFGNNMVSVPELIVYSSPDPNYPFRIHSSIYPDRLFLSDSNGIYRQIFLNLRQFWPDGQ